MKPRIIFLLNSIGVDKGGLTHASLRQASVFADAGYDTEILTFQHNTQFPNIGGELVKRGKVSKKVRIRSMFHERALYSYNDKTNPKMPDINDEYYTGKYAVSKRHNHNAYRLFNNGVYEKYISLRKDGSLDFIDYFNMNRYRTKRELYDYYGNLSCLRSFSFENNQPRQEVYYDKKGEATLSIWYDHTDGAAKRIIHFGVDNQIISETAGDDKPHKLHWLNSVLGEKNDETLVISATRSTDDLLVGMDKAQVTTLIHLHSNHLTDPDDPASELNRRNRYAVRNIHNVDGMIVLTDKQRKDIIDRFGNGEKVFVIPNIYEVDASPVSRIKDFTTQFNTTREINKAVLISRLSSIKNVDHAVHAFKSVVDEIPDAKLEIWGRGDTEESLDALIKELGMTQNVLLKGYTGNPSQVYHSAALSIMTSKAEGFSLAVMESMANSTPVVSYDIRYGPSDMIEDGVNGFLVEKNDIEGIARKIIHMFKNPEDGKDMGKEASVTMKSKFSYKNYRDLWFSLADQLLKIDKGFDEDE